MSLCCSGVGLPGGADHSRITVQVGVGEFVGVVGGPGSGKSALLAGIAGWARQGRGEITLDAVPVGARGARSGIGFVPDPPLLPRELTGTEWVEYLAAQPVASPRERSRRVRVALETARLGAAAARRIGTYSRTQLRQLAVGAAMVRASRLLVLDETMDGMTETVVAGFRAEFARRRLIVVCASRDLAVATMLAERIFVLCRGELVADVPAFEVRNRRVVELDLDPAPPTGHTGLAGLWPGALRRDNLLIIPLGVGRTAEQVLAAAREHRVRVRASVIRPVRPEELGAVLPRSVVDASPGRS